MYRVKGKRQRAKRKVGVLEGKNEKREKLNPYNRTDVKRFYGILGSLLSFFSVF